MDETINVWSPNTVQLESNLSLIMLIVTTMGRQTICMRLKPKA
jgi:hypothetical protein